MNISSFQQSVNFGSAVAYPQLHIVKADEKLSTQHIIDFKM